MAKQTFTTGQVLTAAQMTSLQQTAMLGGAASAKTSSYTLVATDAGTAISMSNASATTITVNTALFAAGDTVQITNLGVGVCTITAGTATVNTSASLSLAQYESGTLYFTSTSAAIFIKGAGSSGGMTLLASGSLGSAGTNLTSIVGTFAELRLFIKNYKPSTDNAFPLLRFNNDSNANRYHETATTTDGINTATAFDGTSLRAAANNDNSVAFGLISISIPLYANTTTAKFMLSDSIMTNATTTTSYNYTRLLGAYNQTAAITELNILPSSGNITSGDYELYGA